MTRPSTSAGTCTWRVASKDPIPLNAIGKAACTAGATATLAGAIAHSPCCDAWLYFQASPPATTNASTAALAAHAPDFAFMILSFIYPRISLDNP
ncbi:hypothetical protein D3C71_1800480 [compost metagenome]